MSSHNPDPPLRDPDSLFDEIIEQHLRHLHEGGAPVDLEALPPEVAGEAEQLLELLDLLEDSLHPPSPPLHLDPVAIRLGLVPAPDLQTAPRWLLERLAAAAIVHRCD